MRNLSQLILPRTELAKSEFRLAFNSASPIQEVVLSERGLFNHVLIRGENYSGRTQAVARLCGDAAMAGIGVIYVTDDMGPGIAAALRAKAHMAFGIGRYHALDIDAEPGRKFKVSRHGVSVLRFASGVAPSNPARIRRRLMGIVEWITDSNFDTPLLLALENYHLYFDNESAGLLEKAGGANCAVVLTTLGSDPRGENVHIHRGIYERCGTILDLNRRRAHDQS